MAELRRDAPGAAARAFMERLEAEMEAEREGDARVEGEKVEGEEVVLEGGRVERIEEVRRMWERGTAGLVGLEKITEVVAKVERAAKAAEAVKEI